MKNTHTCGKNARFDMMANKCKNQQVQPDLVEFEEVREVQDQL